ncbi:hypothetical protein TorRG33x02_112300 [Trema orientale]|uniref:NAC domain containing protein n=1 Tax=Trema orientale TaxID=63057 RepID=A0A2P5F591_TREOI|nr:hypothetical protein TorRG33x02_112300 [Trema orientale]
MIHHLQEEGWVVCRVFKKRMTTVRKVGDYDSPPCWYDDQVSFMPELDSPRRISHHHPAAAFTPYHHLHYTNCKQELELQFNMVPAAVAATAADPFFQLPQLESPKVPFSGSSTALQSSTLTQEDHHQIGNNNSININQHNLMSNSVLFSNEQAVDQVTDWRVLDKFVASQLSHDDQDTSKETSDHYSNAAFHAAHQHMNNLLANDQHLQPKRPEIAQDYASTSTSASCQIDLWK